MSYVTHTHAHNMAQATKFPGGGGAVIDKNKCFFKFIIVFI